MIDLEGRSLDRGSPQILADSNEAVQICSEISGKGSKWLSATRNWMHGTAVRNWAVPHYQDSICWSWSKLSGPCGMPIGKPSMYFTNMCNKSSSQPSSLNKLPAHHIPPPVFRAAQGLPHRVMSHGSRVHRTSRSSSVMKVNWAGFSNNMSWGRVKQVKMMSSRRQNDGTGFNLETPCFIQ